MEKNIKEVTKAILNQFMSWEYDAKNFTDILEPWMFGEYAGIYSLILKYDKEFIYKDFKLSTEVMQYCSSEWLNKFMVEVLQASYYCFDIYKDLVFLIEKYHKHINSNDVFLMVDTIKKKNEAIHRLQSDAESKKYHISTLYEKILSDCMEMQGKTGITGYKTGLPTLDHYIDWFKRWTVLRVTAYSNIGKSKLAYHVCNTLLNQWLSVLFFSLEVTQDMVAHNLMMNMYNKDYFYISRWKWIDDPMIDPGEFFWKNIEIIDTIYHIDQIVQYTKARKPDVIFVDFVQNIQTKWDTEYQAMSEVAIKLQQLAITEKICVFDLSQISQEQAGRYQVWWKIPSKGSWWLVASADVNLVMERDQLTQHNILHIAKNKFWMNGKAIDLDMDFTKNQVKDCWEYQKTYQDVSI